MKKILLIGDIHANRIAFQSILDDAGQVDAILCTGDLVDYNPWPLEVIETVRTRGIQSVLGNHDRDSAYGTPVGYNPNAVISCRWTHNLLDIDSRRYLLNLPKKLTLQVEDVTFFICHGSPDDLVDEYVFPPPMTSQRVLMSYLEKCKANVVVLGHTHIPFIQQLTEGYVVNPGSIGQPRSRDPRASYIYARVDNSEVVLKHRLVEYDINEVASKIYEVGLPSLLARRLYLGV